MDIYPSNWLKKLLNLLGTLTNWRDPGPDEYGDGNPEFPFTGYQAWGAWLTVGIAVLWTGRAYFKAYLDRAFDGDPRAIDRGEALTARQAALSFLEMWAGTPFAAHPAAFRAGLCSGVTPRAGITWSPFASHQGSNPLSPPRFRKSKSGYG